MNKRSTGRITLLTICILIIFLAIGILLRSQSSKETIIRQLLITPTKIASPNGSPTEGLTRTMLTPTSEAKPFASLTSTSAIQIGTPTPIIQSKAPTVVVISNPTSGITLSPTPPLLSISPMALNHMGTQPECQIDTHGGGPYIDCVLTLSNSSQTAIVSWNASISDTVYKLTPSSGQLGPKKNGRDSICGITGGLSWIVYDYAAKQCEYVAGADHVHRCQH